MLCLRTLTSSYLSRLFVSSHSIIIYHFLSQMAGDKRKGKAVVEPKKKKTKQQKEWERVLAVPDTQGQPQRGIRISEGTQSQGEHPQGEQQQQQAGRAADTTAATATSVRQRAPDRRAVRVTTLTRQVRTSDTRWSHTATADTAPEESCSRGAHKERAAGSRSPAPQRSTSRGFRSLSP
jgi:hypothetical protein